MRLFFLISSASLLLALAGCADNNPPPPTPDAGTPDSGGPCFGSRVLCGGECIDTQTDTLHCGACDNSCAPTESCQDGSCAPAVTCSGSEMDCGGSCIDVRTSNLHCGMCSRGCAPGEDCIEGSCAPRECDPGTMRCGTACVDTTSDDANCGGCAMPCEEDESCEGSTCVPTCTAPADTVCTTVDMGEMNSRCVDLLTDDLDCGSCGNPCIDGRVCIDGDCECEAPSIACAPGCIDPMTDPNHCGMCDNACPMDSMCMDGDCVCTTGLTLCTDTCVNTDVDNAHCGMCDNPCATPAETCVAGTCVSACGPGTVMCGGTCANIQVDPAHCGMCDNPCAMGESCVAGVCRPDGPPNDDRLDAEEITLGDAEVTIMGSTTDSTRDGPSVSCFCTVAFGNVWYKFTLTETAVVYFDTAGSTLDTSLFLTDSGGTPVPGQASAGFPSAGLCNDDSGCDTVNPTDWTTNRQSRLAGRLGAGTYYLAVGGCGTGDFTLHAQRLRDQASFSSPFPVSGMGTRFGPLIGSNTTTGTCGGSASGEDQRWFVTCGNQPQFFSLCKSDGGTFTRSNGTTNFDPTMYVRSAMTGMQVVCNDDGGTMGGTDCTGDGGDSLPWGSRINDVVTPRGLNAIFVDERSGGSGMDYTMQFVVR